MEKIEENNKNAENLKKDSIEDKKIENEIKKKVIVKNIKKEEKVKLTINYIKEEKLEKDAEELNFLSMRLGDIRNLQNCKNLKVK